MLGARWIDGLNVPKGLRSFGDRLWVADIDRLLPILITQGKILESFELLFNDKMIKAFQLWSGRCRW